MRPEPGLARSVALLTDPTRPVSTHYLVPDAADEGKRLRVYTRAPESTRAWYAGISDWQGEHLLNASSIGIEIDAGGKRVFRRQFDAFAEVADEISALAQAAHTLAPGTPWTERARWLQHEACPAISRGSHGLPAHPSCSSADSRIRSASSTRCTE